MLSGRNRRKAEQEKSRDEAERRQRQTSLMTCDDRRRLRRVDSDYNRERLLDSWTRNLQQMFNKAEAPESRWWTQYLLMATVSITP